MPRKGTTGARDRGPDKSASSIAAVYSWMPDPQEQSGLDPVVQGQVLDRQGACKQHVQSLQQPGALDATQSGSTQAQGLQRATRLE